jgi:hypothetical protein
MLITLLLLQPHRTGAKYQVLAKIDYCQYQQHQAKSEPLGDKIPDISGAPLISFQVPVQIQTWIL